MLITNFNPFPLFETERLLLRKLSTKDVAEVLKMRSDERVMKYIDRERAKTLADAETFINRINHSWFINEGITWGIELKEGPGVLIGTIGYWRIMKEHFRAEIGYMLNPDYWRNGIMKEALVKVIDIGFTQIKLHSMEAHINPFNTGSSALLLSTGFVREAYFKENFYFNGEFRDSEIYSLLQPS